MRRVVLTVSAVVTLTLVWVGAVNRDNAPLIQAARLEIEKADLPTGSHQIRIAIKDISGNPNERDAVVNVSEK